MTLLERRFSKGAVIMSNSLATPCPQAPAPAARRCISISETPAGDWLVRQRGADDRHFPTQQAAVHFVLFELGQGPASALLTPPPPPAIRQAVRRR